MEGRTKFKRDNEAVISVIRYLNAERLPDKLFVLELSVAAVKAPSLNQNYLKHFVEAKAQYDLVAVAHDALTRLGFVDGETGMGLGCVKMILLKFRFKRASWHRAAVAHLVVAVTRCQHAIIC